MRVRHDPELHRWEPMTVDALAEVITPMRERVWLSGGVALDVAVGRATREHGDIDLSVLDTGWRACAESLPEWMLLHAAEGGYLRLIDPAEVPVPHSTWCEDARTGAMVLQVNAERGTGTEWIYRRDPRVSLPWDRAVLRVEALPVVAPVVQLLWKSAAPQAKDELDWTVHAPRLGPRDRAWLRSAVELAHPSSPWIGR